MASAKAHVREAWLLLAPDVPLRFPAACVALAEQVARCTLGFTLVEDTDIPEQDSRYLLIKEERGILGRDIFNHVIMLLNGL